MSYTPIPDAVPSPVTPELPLSQVFEQVTPWAPGEIAKTNIALASIDASPEAIRVLRPPLPQIGTLPDRFGYGHVVPDVDDCVSLDRDPAARYDFSGQKAGYGSSSVPSMGVW